MFSKDLLLLILLVSLASTQDLWPSQSFETGGFHPPVLEITKSGASLATGLILFSPETSSGLERTAVMIMTDDGELIWNGPNSTAYANLFMQTLDDEPVLSYWAGIGTNIGHGYGNVTILDTTYSVLYTVCPEGSDIVTPCNVTYDCYADFHESFITPRNSILFTKVNVTRADLTSVNGSADGWVFDTVFYEIDIKTNEVLFRWSALEAGIPINATKVPLGPVDELKGGTGDNQTDPFDWFHANSIQSVGDGYLINSRHLWTTWMLNSTADIQWSIQGDTGGDFSLPEEAQFEWQHEPRISNITSTSATLHYFNNRNAGFVNASGVSQTDGLELLLGFENFSIVVNHSLTDPADPIFATSQGSFSRLSNDNYFMGYGEIPKIKEYSSDGIPIMTLQYGNESTAQSYRAYRQEWYATPYWDPVAVGKSGVAYMSWNGATNVTKWDVYMGLSEDNLTHVGTVANSGFETSFNLSNSVGYLQVSAFDGDTFLRNSSVVALS